MKLLFTVILFFSYTRILANEINLDFGLRLGQRHSSSAEQRTDLSPMMGFVGFAGYWTHHWAFGIQASGSISTKAKTYISTESGNAIAGKYNYRPINYGPVIRYYFDEYNNNYSKNYLQIGATISSSEIYRPNWGIPTSDDDEIIRSFLNGYGLLMSFGREFHDSPFFIRMDYSFERFNEIKIIMTDDGFGKTLSNERLKSHISVQSIYVTLGLNRIF